MTLYDQFIQDVKKDNPSNHNKLVHLAVDRHLADLKKTKQKSYPYTFDRDKADRAIKIIKIFRHTKGSFKGKLFDLQPYQAFIIANIFGWCFKDDGTRRFQKSYLEMARKNGKSEFAGAVECILAFFDGEPGADVFSVATKRDQALYVYNAAREMMKQLREDSSSIHNRIKLKQFSIIDEATGSRISTLTADHDKEDGANPHAAVVDEYHSHSDDGIYKVIETGTVGRDNPHIMIITTAGFYKHYPCFIFRQNVAVPTLMGNIDNDRVFVMIFTIDEGDNWEDENVWIKANPGLGKAPNLRTFRSQYENAKIEGEGTRVQFMTKNLNVWMDAAKTWIPDEDWKELADTSWSLDDPRLVHQNCIIGVDLSSSKDITALYYLFPSVSESLVAIPAFYCPKDKIQLVKRVDKVDYRTWEKAGHIIATIGDVIDRDKIKDDILAAYDTYDVQMVCFDPWNAHELSSQLEQAGLKCFSVPQTVRYLHPSTKKIEEMVAKKNLIHNGNPVMDWMMQNVVIKQDHNGNRKIDKSKSYNKVDGPVALSIALAGLLNAEVDQLIGVDDLGVLEIDKTD